MSNCPGFWIEEYKNIPLSKRPFSQASKFIIKKESEEFDKFKTLIFYSF
ncbi:MAG: hypothetical protein AAF349_09810 [Cyanobacteria bacterium P01_A01_bin.68]